MTVGLSDGVYDRQRQLPLWVPPAIIVVGCGGVGFWVALFSALSGVEHIVLVDPDRVEVSNLNRIALMPSDVGRPKAEVLAEVIHSVRPGTRVYPVVARVGPQGVTLQELLDMLEMQRYGMGALVYDCTDHVPTQAYIAEQVAEMGLSDVRRIRAGYDGGEHITVTKRPPPQWGDEGQGYEVVPSWVVPAALAAALAVYKGERMYRDESAQELSAPIWAFWRLGRTS